MGSIIVDTGRQRILKLLVEDATHLAFGRKTWVDPNTPPAEDDNAQTLGDLIGYAKITARKWVVEDVAGPLRSPDGKRYSYSNEPTKLACLEATIPDGESEGAGNAIGQIGVVGGGVATDPEGAIWTYAPSIIELGKLFRIQNIVEYEKPPDFEIVFSVIFPLFE